MTTRKGSPPKQAPAADSLMEQNNAPERARQAANVPEAQAPAPVKRERPTHHTGEANIKANVLDEMEQAAQQRIASGQRVSLSPKLKLAWNDVEPDFNYQWASDSENYPINLQQMVDAGYTFVRHKYGSIAGDKVIQHSKGCNLYLMRCPLEYFEADQARIHEKTIQQHKEIMEVGSREYAGKSKQLGEGQTVELDYTDNPQDALSLMGKE